MSDTTSEPSTPGASTPPSSVPSSPKLSASSTRDVLNLPDASEKAKQEAAKVKAEANKAFIGTLLGLVTRPPQLSEHLILGHHFNDAVDLYSKAIDLNPKDATLWCNRAYTRIKLEEHGYALLDAGESQRDGGWKQTLINLAATAIQLDPKYSKAYYRYASRLNSDGQPSTNLVAEQHVIYRH